MDRIAIPSCTGIAAVALLAAAAPAAAQSAPLTSAAYTSNSKTEAILGGGSRLAAILAQQSGQPQPPAPDVSPAGYGAVSYRAVMPASRPPVASDRPDVFGTVALAIGRTPLDARWRKAARPGATFVPAAYRPAMASMSAMERIDAVNRYVNDRTRFVDDVDQYGVADRWQTAAETLRRGRGDCEDYAIAKLELLRRAGFAEDDLYLVILRDLTRRSDHAVLVVRAEGRLWVLDNGTNRIADSDDINDYRPIMTFSGNRSWTHGYRVQPPVMIAASTPPAPTITLAAASLSTASPAGL